MSANDCQACQFLRYNFLTLETIKARISDAIINNNLEVARKSNTSYKHFLGLLSASMNLQKNALNFFRANPSYYVSRRLDELESYYAENIDQDMLNRITIVKDAIRLLPSEN